MKNCRIDTESWRDVPMLCRFMPDALNEHERTDWLSPMSVLRTLFRKDSERYLLGEKYPTGIRFLATTNILLENPEIGIYVYPLGYFFNTYHSSETEQEFLWRHEGRKRLALIQNQSHNKRLSRILSFNGKGLCVFYEIVSK